MVLLVISIKAFICMAVNKVNFTKRVCIRLNNIPLFGFTCNIIIGVYLNGRSVDNCFLIDLIDNVKLIKKNYCVYADGQNNTW
jgi:hypothetical protein